MESVEKLKNITVFEKTGPFSGNFSEKGPVLLSTPLPCPSRFLHSPFTKCGENPGERSLKTKVMQQNAADKGTKKAIYFQNFRKSKLHPQKNSTTHEKIVEKNAIHATSRLQPVWMNGTPPIRHVGAATHVSLDIPAARHVANRTCVGEWYTQCSGDDSSPCHVSDITRAVEWYPSDMSSRPSETSGVIYSSSKFYLVLFFCTTCWIPPLHSAKA